jgi:Peptidogalycan biosysnthesis/recognition
MSRSHTGTPVEARHQGNRSGRFEVAVHDTVRAVQPATSDQFLGEQWLREIGRLEAIWRWLGVTPRYVVATVDGRTVGLLPVYIALGRHYAGLTAASLFDGVGAVRDWRRGVWIGTDGTTSNVLAGAGRPDVAVAVVEAAVALAMTADPDHICLPNLDDDQYRAVTAVAPMERAVVGESGEAVIDLAFDTFEEYVQRLPSRRTAIRRERRRFLASDLELRQQPLEQVTGALAGLLAQVEQKYGTGSKEAEEAYLLGIAAATGRNSSALMVYDGGRPVAGSVLWDLGGDWRVRCWGCDYDHPAVRRDHLYFNLMYYEPMMRACAAGASRLLLGSGSLDTKVLRGARVRRRRSVAWSGGAAAHGK